MQAVFVAEALWVAISVQAEEGVPARAVGVAAAERAAPAGHAVAAVEASVVLNINKFCLSPALSNANWGFTENKKSICCVEIQSKKCIGI